MAIRFSINGIQVECDTPAEAAITIRELQQAKPPTPRPKRAVASSSGENHKSEKDAVSGGPFARLMESLDGEPRKVVVAVRDAEEPIDIDDLSAKTHIGQDDLSYAIRRARAIAQECGLDPDKLLVKERPRIEGKRATQYAMPERAKQALSSM